MKQFAIALLATAVLTACSGDNSTVVSDNGSVGGTGTGNTGTAGSVADNTGGTGTGNTDNGNIGTADTGTGNTDTFNAGTGNTNNNPNTTSTPASNNGAIASSLTASHRNGQTFLVWTEVDDSTDYHVYRHTSPITSANLSSATRLTERWGPLDQNTSVNRYGGIHMPNNFVINDSGQPLADNQGLFVHTTQNNQQGNAYYAVTSVSGGRESSAIAAGSNATTQAVGESVRTPRPVLTASLNGGKGRLYTQYMDYANWNPTLKGYAFGFAVALPANYNSSVSYPLRVELHAFGEQHKFVGESEFDWPVIQLFPNDPGDSVNTAHAWWYGFARDHNYQTQGSVPRSGAIENFTEQRVLASVDFLLDDGQYNIDRSLVHLYGHSMGGSGALSLGMRYPSVFAGIYASQPMTNYGASPLFQENYVRLWGERSANLPIVNGGRNNSAIRNYDSTGSQSTGVWNWMNHQEQLVRRRADRFAYLMVDHGKSDGTIDWQTQGRLMAQVFTNARVGFSASAVGGVGHSWLGFDSVVSTVFGFGNGARAGWLYPRELSFPGIHNATGSGSLQPAATGDDRHNTTLEWATPLNNFHQGIVDTSNRYEITLRSMTVNQTADITPRNTGSFRPAAGTRCSWTARNVNGNGTIGSGNSTVDNSRLLTIPRVSIMSGGGTRLTINCP